LYHLAICGKRRVSARPADRTAIKEEAGMADQPYLMRGIKQVATDSSTLVSSSKYLNDPRIRDWVSTHMLRRSGQDRPSPSDPGALVGYLMEVQDGERLNALLQEERKKSPRLDAWFREGFVSTYGVQDLAKYKPGTVGGIFYTYLNEKGFEVDLVRRFVPKNDYQYYLLRNGQTHDLEHIIGGGGFDYLGELVPYYIRLTNVFKFFDSELAGELSVLQILGSTRIMTRAVLHYPQTWPTVVETIERGIAVGKQSDEIFMNRYEDVFDMPLTEARLALGVRGARDVDTSDASNIWEEKVQNPGPEYPDGVRASWHARD
jgi:ubiquinone biosynthesis protein Coq4